MDKLAGGVKDPFFVSVLPERNAAIHATTALSIPRIEAPEFFSRRGIQRKKFEASGGEIHAAVDHQWIAFDCAAGPTRVVATVNPRWLEPANVVAINLFKGGIFRAGEVAAVDGPVRVVLRMKD